MEYPDELTFIRAEAGDILGSNFYVTQGDGKVVMIDTSENGIDVSGGTILLVVTFRINEGTEEGVISGLNLVLHSPADLIESKEKRLLFDITQGQVIVEAAQEEFEPTDPIEPISVLVSAETSTKDFISIVETGRNSNLWELTFNVRETWSGGEVRVMTHVVLISSNNANVDGRYNLGAYTLIYDIKGNGSNIRDFRVVMN